MFKEARNFFALIPASQSTAVSPAGSGIRLGPRQPMKLAFRLPFVRQGPPLIVPEACKLLWFEKGWRRTANAKEYTGHYAAAGRTWRGLILEPYPKRYTAYIWNPPKPDIQRNTSHGPCFSPNGESGRYQIHFHSTPLSLDHVITSIEAVLTQAVKHRA